MIVLFKLLSKISGSEGQLVTAEKCSEQCSAVYDYLVWNKKPTLLTPKCRSDVVRADYAPTLGSGLGGVYMAWKGVISLLVASTRLELKESGNFDRKDLELNPFDLTDFIDFSSAASPNQLCLDNKELMQIYSKRDSIDFKISEKPKNTAELTQFLADLRSPSLFDDKFDQQVILLGLKNFEPALTTLKQPLPGHAQGTQEINETSNKLIRSLPYTILGKVIANLWESKNAKVTTTNHKNDGSTMTVYLKDIDNQRFLVKQSVTQELPNLKIYIMENAKVFATNWFRLIKAFFLSHPQLESAGIEKLKNKENLEESLIKAIETEYRDFSLRVSRDKNSCVCEIKSDSASGLL